MASPLNLESSNPQESFFEEMSRHANGRHIIRYYTESGGNRSVFAQLLGNAKNQGYISDKNVRDIMGTFDRIFSAHSRIQSEPPKMAPSQSLFKKDDFMNRYPLTSVEYSDFEFAINCCAFPGLAVNLVKHGFGIHYACQQINIYYGINGNPSSISIEAILKWLNSK
jgi:hypothetical protein